MVNEFRILPELSRYRIYRDGRIESVGSRYAFLSGSADQYGYIAVHVTFDDGRQAKKRRHSLICRAFHGPKPPNMEVRHLDGSRTNDHADNLEWATHATNCADTIKHGTSTRGERNKWAKLSLEIVRTIRQKSDFPLSVWAKKYGVSENTIWAAKIGLTWAWVDRP